MNLNQLRFASAVARLESFSRAADECHVTQPTLSNAIAQLEERVGGRLFERTTRTVSLTAFGKHMLPSIDGVLASLADLDRTRDAFWRPAVKLARIGLSPVVDMTRLAGLIAPFKSKHPDVEIVYKECVLDDLGQRLDGQQIDIAVWPEERPPHPGLEHTPLYDDALMYLPSSTRDIAPQRTATIAVSDLAGDTFVMSEGLCGLAQTTQRLFDDNGLAVTLYRGRAVSYSMLQEWADLGIGSAILPVSKLAGTRAAEARAVVTGKQNHRSVMTIVASWKLTTEVAPHIASLQKSLRQG
jgi:DNA-binding transcriptional LysR family regulator